MKVSVSMLKAIWLAVLLLLVFSGPLLTPYLLVPTVAIIWAAPLVHAMLPLKGQPDERQLYIAQSSGQMAYYLMLGLLLIVIIKDYILAGKQLNNMLYMLLIVPISTKFYISIFQNYSHRQAARLLTGFIALIFIIFNFLSHPLFSMAGIIQVFPFFVLLGTVLMIPKYPTASAIILTLFSLPVLYFLIKCKFDFYLKVTLLALLAVPIVLSAFYLFKHEK